MAGSKTIWEAPSAGAVVGTMRLPVMSNANSGPGHVTMAGVLTYIQANITAPGISALTGDVTASGTGSVVATLATVNSNVGTFGSASQVGAFTVNGKGLITAASSTAIQIAQSQVTSLVADLALKAPLASPTFTGTVVLPAGQVVNGVTLQSGGAATAFLNQFGTYSTPAGTGVSSVSGTTNRITSTGGTTPVIDISADYVGQASIGTVGTLTSGATGAGFTIDLNSSTVTGRLGFSNISQIAANTVLANPTNATANISTVALAASQLLGRGATGDIAAITLGTNLSMTGTTLNVTGGGDVVGPTGATNNAVALFDTTTGKLLKNSTVLIDPSTGNTTGFGTIASGPIVITSTSASAFVVGPNGATNPALLIDNSQASGNTGWSITSGASTRTTIQVISPNANENGDVMAKVNGALRVGTTGNGGTFNVRLGTTNYVTVTNALTTISTASVSMGNVTTGVWQGTVVSPTYGGTGVNNGSSTITIGGNLTVSGAFTTALTVTANTSVTLPTTGTLATLAGAEALTNKSVNGVTLTTAGSATNFLNAAGSYVSTGSVTTVSVVSANGFAGSVATATSTPAITISTSVTGILKGNGTAISAATAGTDYQAPITLTTTGSAGAATFIGNTLNIPVYSSGGGSVAFTDILSGTNVSAAMVVGSGATLGVSGSGTIDATSVPLAGISGLGTGVATALAVNTGTAGAFVVNGGALGTPTSGTLTNATGLPIASGVSGLGAGIATFLATPSSANLATAVTDETGSGALVFGTAPSISGATITTSTVNGVTLVNGGTSTLYLSQDGTYTTPAGGGSSAFSSITSGTNTAAAMVVGTGASLAVSGSGTIAATSAPLAGISGLGSGVGTFLATPTSANLLAAVTGTTGTGDLVFATAPSISGATITTSTVNGVTLVNGGTATLYLSQDGTYTTPAGGGSSAFSALTSGTNTAAAMVVGSGATLDVTGTGTINATSVVAANEATDTTCFLAFLTDATGSLGVKTNANLVFNSNTALFGLTGTQVITSSSATALSVGQNGATNPALVVNSSTATSVAGLSISSRTSGNGPVLAAIGGTNEPITYTTKGSGHHQFVTTGSGGQIQFQMNGAGNTRYTFADTAITFAPTSSNAAGTVRFAVTASADTGLNAGTEAVWVNFNGAVTRQHSSNTTITTQRDFRIQGTNHSFASATGTITNLGALSLNWGNAGTNAAFTHNAALYIPTQSLTGTQTNAYAIRVAAPSGATNNFAISATGTSELGTVQNTRINPRVVSTASSGTPTPNADTTDEYILTALAATATFGAPTGTPGQGQAMVIRIKDNGTARALSFNAIYRAIGITLPTTTVISKTMYLTMIYNFTDTKWDVLAVGQEA